MKKTLDDLRLQVAADKSMGGGDAWLGGEGIKLAADTATASEVMGKPYAYVDWLKVAAMCVVRADALATPETREEVT